MTACLTTSSRRLLKCSWLMAVCGCGNAALATQEGGPRGSDANIDGDDAATNEGDGGGAQDSSNPSCSITVSNYDHSCVTDTDCVSEVPFDAEVGASGAHTFMIPVASGNYCSPRCNCYASEF